MAGARAVIALTAPGGGGALDFDRPHDAPSPTEATQDFVLESRRVATQRRNLLGGSLGAGFALALTLAGLAYWQRGVADEQRRIAVEQRGQAITQRDRALVTQSRFLTNASNRRRDLGDLDRSLALALEALPTDGADRPYLPEAEQALRSAYRDWQALQFMQSVVASLQTALNTAEISPDGTLFAMALGPDVSVREIVTGRELATLRGEDSNVWAIEFMPSGDYLLVASKKSFRVWNLKERKVVSQNSAPSGQQICGRQYSAQKIDVGVAPAESQVGHPKIITLDEGQGTRQTVGGSNCSLFIPPKESQALFQQLMGSALYIL